MILLINKMNLYFFPLFTSFPGYLFRNAEWGTVKCGGQAEGERTEEEEEELELEDLKVPCIARV